MLRAGSARRDGGFTLIELLITVVIMGVITIPLGNLIIEYFQNAAQTTGRLAESHDAQIAAAYFAQDAASIGTRDATTGVLKQSVWQGSAGGAPYTCGSATPVVLFAWDQYNSASISSGATVIEVAYQVNTVGTERQLQRVYCGGPSATQSMEVLGHDLDPSTDPSVTCLLNGTAEACGNSGSNTPTTIQLTVTMKDTADSANYQVTLTGQRRQT